MRKANESSLAVKKNIDEEITNQLNSSLDKSGKELASKDRPFFISELERERKLELLQN